MFHFLPQRDNDHHLIILQLQGSPLQPKFTNQKIAGIKEITYHLRCNELRMHRECEEPRAKLQCVFVKECSENHLSFTHKKLSNARIKYLEKNFIFRLNEYCFLVVFFTTMKFSLLGNLQLHNKEST